MRHPPSRGTLVGGCVSTWGTLGKGKHPPYVRGALVADTERIEQAVWLEKKRFHGVPRGTAPSFVGTKPFFENNLSLTL